MNREEAAEKILKWLDSEGWQYSIRENQPSFDLICKVDVNVNGGFVVCIDKKIERVIIFKNKIF